MRSICLIFFLILTLNTAMAVKAPPYPVQVRQPDGSIITLYIRGDELYRYCMDAYGRRMVKGTDGFFRPATPHTPEEAAAIRAHNAARLLREPVTVNRSAAQSETRVLIIPVEFQDLDFTVDDPAGHFDRMLNTPGYQENGGTGSAKDYFEANMPGRQFRFNVAAPVRLSRPYSYYGENDASTPSVITYDVRLPELVEEACSLADAQVDFSQYDTDGDGQADFVFFFLAGYNEAESGDNNAIWPQTYNISQEGIRADGVRIGLFGCSSELSGSNPGIDGAAIPSGIGNFCHEFGHFLGLVDLYDTDYGKDGTSNCLWGKLSLMDEGNYNNSGRTPPYFCAIDRELTGTAAYSNITAGSTFTLSPIEDNGDVIRIPTGNNSEYYLIENRSGTGWDAYIEGAGMVAYHIDKSKNIVEGITAAVRWTTNMVNTCSSHECADLVEAFPEAGHISQVFFPGQAGITELSAAGDPAFIAWDGTPVGLRLSSIMLNGRTVSFDVHEDVSEILLTPTAWHIDAFQNKAVLRWDPGRPGSYRWAVNWGDSPDGPYRHSDTAHINRYTFGDLQPKTDYFCSLYHIGKHGNGDTVTIRFSTQALTSPYPYILLKRHYSAGDTLEMVINNITEECSSVIWYINGWRALSDRYIFREVGEYEIKAVLEYSSDGSKEEIIRRLTVNDAFIREDENE